MSTVKPYPHYEINVIDNSIYTVQYDEVLPIHRPVYVMKTQEGPAGIPVWCPSYSHFAQTFGSETFNEGNNKYFSPQAFFLKNTFTYNGAFIVRAIDGSAKKAFCILEAVVTPVSVNNGITQYEKDDSGNRITDDDGNYVPRLDGDSNPVKEKGISITYRTRYAFTPAESQKGLSLAELEVETKVDGTKIYPLFAFEALYEGEYGNDLVFQMFYKTSENDEFDVMNNGSINTTFAPLRRNYNESTYAAHRDIYGGTSQTFCIKPQVIDPVTGISSSMDAILKRAYSENTTLPYTIYSYQENVCKVGNRIIAAELDASGEMIAEAVLGFQLDDDSASIESKMIEAGDVEAFALADKSLLVNNQVIPLTADNLATYLNTQQSVISNSVTNDMVIGDFSVEASDLGYKVNIFSLMNTSKQIYDHVVFGEDEAGVSMVEGYNIFLKGGDDGSLSDVMVENAIRAFCKFDLCPEIEDEFKYPFTHMYDCGFNTKTKFAMLDFLDNRPDVAVELSTQVLFDEGMGKTIKLNDQMDDESLGEVLRSYALLMRESIAKGTECCRASIYTQAGYPVAPTYDKPVPCTYWSAMKHAEYCNLPYMSGQEPRGWPYSYNELFKLPLNWVPYSKSSRSRLWDNGFNYCMSADMTRVFYPALRSVYRYDTSALVDQWFVDAIVYLKHEVRKSWGKHTGRNDYTDILQSDITKDLEEKIGTLFGGKYRFTVRVYQTTEEAKIGYIQHVAITIIAPNTNRVWDVDIIVEREGLTTEG